MNLAGQEVSIELKSEPRNIRYRDEYSARTALSSTHVLRSFNREARPSVVVVSSVGGVRLPSSTVNPIDSNIRRLR